MLDRLEADGLIIRTPSLQDRRVVLIHLAYDHSVIRDLFCTVSEEMISLFYQGFTPQEVEQFEEQLRRIIHNLLEIV